MRAAIRKWARRYSTAADKARRQGDPAAVQYVKRFNPEKWLRNGPLVAAALKR